MSDEGRPMVGRRGMPRQWRLNLLLDLITVRTNDAGRAEAWSRVDLLDSRFMRVEDEVMALPSLGVPWAGWL